ncbi:MAG TPA: YggT family protein [Candidatus Limnocylindrales bacterium]|nr:YggT family protein [Candidatus Limnocylindrales bacterium]
MFLSNLIQVAFIAVWLLIVGRVVLSWVDPAGRSQIGGFVVSATEPILAPVRRALPRTGMIDLSPLIVLIVLSVLWRLF